MQDKTKELNQFLYMFGEWNDQIKKCLITKELCARDDLSKELTLTGESEMVGQSMVSIRKDPECLIKSMEDSINSTKTGVVLCFNKNAISGEEGSCERIIRHVSGYYRILESSLNDIESIKDDGVLLFDGVPYVGNNFSVDDIKKGFNSFSLALINAEVNTDYDVFSDDMITACRLRAKRINYSVFNLIKMGCRSLILVTDEFSMDNGELNTLSREIFIGDVATCVYSVLQIVPRFEIYIGGYDANVAGQKFYQVWQKIGGEVI